MSDDKAKKINTASKFLSPTKQADASLEVFKNPKEINRLALSLFSNKGFSYADYKGKTTEQGTNDHLFINKRGQMALMPDVKITALNKKQREQQGLLLPPPPDATVSQLKNLLTLIVMLERENRRRERRGEAKTTDLDFYFKNYAKERGKTEQEIEKGGKYRDLFKFTLISGGITTFISEDKKYYKIRHHHFYNLDIPKNPKDKWKIYFNEPYANTLLNFTQYTPLYIKAIRDTKTDHNKGYLLFFLLTVLDLENNPQTGFKTQLKVSTLLDYIKISDFIKSRPQEVYKVLAECISYVVDGYKAILTEIRLLNGKGGVKVIKDLNIFKTADYERFKADYLKDLGLTDIRDTLISFNPITLKANELAEPEPTDYQEGEFIAG